MSLEVKNRSEVAFDEAPLKPRASARRRILWVGVVLAVVVLTLLALAGIKLRSSLLAVQAEANQGKAELLAGAAIIKKGGAGLTHAEASQAMGRFQAGEVHFRKANETLRESRLISAVGLLPGIDRQVVSGRRLTDMGVHLARAGKLGVQALAVFSTKGPKQGPGEKILAILDAVDPKLNAITGELRAVEQDRNGIPANGLLPPVRQAVDQFDDKFKPSDINSLITGLQTNEPILRQILGAPTPRTYLVIQQDPAELRGTGGFIGSVGFLSFDHGRMAPFKPDDVYKIDTPNGVALLGPPGTASHVDAPAPLVKIFKLPSWTLRDSNWSPDFPTAAQEAEFLLNRETHRQVDGVIAIDPFFISKLLAVIGPTVVPETGDIVDSANFYPTTLKRIHPESGPAQGKSFLSQAANAIFSRLLSTTSAEYTPLFQAVQSGCASKSVQTYFNDPTAEGFVTRSRCDGHVLAPPADGLMVVESNVGGNKDDFWMQRTYHLRVAVQPDGSVVHTLVLHYGGLSAHGQATGTWGYTGWLRVYLPETSSVLTISGADLTMSRDLNRPVLEGWFYVQFNSAPDLIIVYNTDAATVRASSNHLALLWQKQAGRQGDPIEVQLALPASWKLVGSRLNGGVVTGTTVKTDLSVDRQFDFRYKRS